ncbi:MAG TPA: catalase family peroxidase [Thermoleophilaceae bacterium]|nr:catalase family peroxidase [Thermoleophilaceae bacterium]
MDPLAQEAVDLLGQNYGRHEGQRAVHAKGTVCKGTFVATPEAARLTRAVHMQGDPVPVTTRFSNGSGDPSMPDYAQDGRGMAVKFYLPDGSRTDIVALNLPRFFVRTPEDFVKFTRVGKRLPVINQPSPLLGLYLVRHREALPAVRAFLALKPPASYARVRYNGLHAFRWVAADGRERHVRYSWLPEAGEATISGGDAKRAGRDYLRDEIVDRLGREPVRFTLQVQLAGEGDPTADPTAVWPDDRETVAVGTLELTDLEAGRDTGGDILVFDPTRLTDGIELSDDPIPAFRSRAYSVSVERRAGVSRPPELD